MCAAVRRKSFCSLTINAWKRFLLVFFYPNCQLFPSKKKREKKDSTRGSTISFFFVPIRKICFAHPRNKDLNHPGRPSPSVGATPEVQVFNGFLGILGNRIGIAKLGDSPLFYVSLEKSDHLGMHAATNAVCGVQVSYNYEILFLLFEVYLNKLFRPTFIRTIHFHNFVVGLQILD